MTTDSTSVFRSDLLAGQTAIVTGGGSGIGQGIALALARQGANVAVLGRTLEKLESTTRQIEALGREALALPADVRDDGAVQESVAKLVDKWGRLDIVISSAAGNFLSPAAALSSRGFRAVIDIDLVGTFHIARASFEHLAKRGGSIVSISATQATVPTPLQCHAGAAKAAIEKLTRDLALEWAKMGVRVNAVSPGPIEGTEGMSRLAPGDTKKILYERVPLGRWGTIDEIADTVLFLVGPSGRFITGTTILVDGGTSLWGGGVFMEMMNLASD